MARRPNILITIADDQQAAAVGALGLTDVRTPALDTMVSRGACFNRAHHFGSCHPAVCAPSRAMLHTGGYYFGLPQSLVSGGGFNRLSPEEQHQDLDALLATPLLGELLGQNGYVTFGTGKWHNGPAAFNRSFQDGASIFFGGMCDHDKVPIHPYDPTGAYPDERQTKGALFSTDLFVEPALRFIESYDRDAPFFLYVSFTAPHDPRTPLPEWDAMYPRDRIALPPNFMPDHPFDNGHIYDLRDELLAPWPRTEEVVRQHIGDYYGMITHMDHTIGRLTDALSSRGLLDDTLVIHTGDHGLAVGQHGLLGKQNMYDHSVMVPLMMMGPGIPSGQRIDALTYQHDLFPTLLETAGVDVPESCCFRSLRPLLAGDTDTHYSSVCSGYMNYQRMVKDERYKLIRYYQDEGRGVDRVQLFDHAADPYELHDLSEDTAHTAQRKALEAELARWMHTADDPLAET